MKNNNNQTTNIFPNIIFTSVTIIWITILSCFGCAPIDVRIDYNKKVNFEKYKTYGVIDNEQPDIVDINISKEALDDLIVGAIDKALMEQGFYRDKDPDFYITYYFVVDAKTNEYIVQGYYSDIYYSNLGYGGPPPVSSATLENKQLRKSTYEQGMLMLDIVDSKTKERIWRGYAQSRIGIYKEPEKQKERATTAINKILANFPP
ncbi:DUF4136 domain-containing protein [Kaarinaea lacus]